MKKDTTQQLKDWEIMDKYESFGIKEWKAYDFGRREALEDELKFLEFKVGQMNNMINDEGKKYALIDMRTIRREIKEEISRVKKQLGEMK